MVKILNKTSMSRHLTCKDYSCLINLISDDLGKAHVSPHGLHMLYLMTENSTKSNSNVIPGNLVTLKSEIILTNDKMQKKLVRIVLPMDIENENDISVYSPIGIACLGKRKKDFVFVKHNDDSQKFLIEEIIFQPEKGEEIISVNKQ
jgi:hypothetical protein